MATGYHCHFMFVSSVKIMAMKFIKIAIKYFRGKLTTPAENAFFDDVLDNLQIYLYFGLVALSIIIMIKMIIDAQ